MNLLKFGQGNSKLGKQIWHVSLPAGWSCPGAKECLARVPRAGGKLMDGPDSKFRCFSASQEVLYKQTRDARWHNFDLLTGKSMVEMVALISASLPKNAEIVRIHIAGDFFSEAYFKAWLRVAESFPDTLFYAYTKSLNLWVKKILSIPANFKLTASEGGKHDALIEEFGLKSAKVVFTTAQAAKAALPIDHDDSLAYGQDKSFALLLHGTQAAQSPAAKALSALKTLGIGSYPNK